MLCTLICDIIYICILFEGESRKFTNRGNLLVRELTIEVTLHNSSDLINLINNQRKLSQMDTSILVAQTSTKEQTREFLCF